MLIDCRIRGMKTNIPFLLNVLTHPEFETGIVTTAVIDKNPQLKRVSKSSWDFNSDDQGDQKKVKELERCPFFSNAMLSNAFPADMWGGTTFDVVRRPFRPSPLAKFPLSDEEELVKADTFGVVLVDKFGCSLSLTKASIEVSPLSPPLDMLPIFLQASMLLSRLLTSATRRLIEYPIRGVEDQHTVPPQRADPAGV